MEADTRLWYNLRHPAEVGIGGGRGPSARLPGTYNQTCNHRGQHEPYRIYACA